MLPRLRKSARGALRCLWEGLKLYGMMEIGGPDSLPPLPVKPGDPGPFHPERVRSDIPLNRREREIARQLRDLT
ncbi:DUF6059 family protein [Streptacidiphilus sp. P02-A3a]|uniref:DUF6059 family protein n=1 Tax=Streptacidiphilus sp. P02-A3a TaxID=2704468 RepID=UPI001CDD242A|nr:DUF6059 family protein [Streptacidiphilus sp. P02-A3a]